MASDLIFSWLGQLVAAGGGGALVAYGVFQFLGKSWIENQLAKDLEIAKSEISILATRKLKLHDKEYIVFPEVWSKLDKVVASLGNSLTSFRQIPNFDLMTELKQVAWVRGSDLSKLEKTYFLSASDKLKAYSRILDLRSLLEVKKDYIDFHTYLQSNRIFLSPDVKGKFDKISNLIRESWIAKQFDLDEQGNGFGRDFLIEAYEKYKDQVNPIMLEIELLVQKKLFPGNEDKL